MRKILGLVLIACLFSVGALAGAPMGVYRGAGSTGVGAVPAFETWLGRPMERAMDALFFTNCGDASTANSPISLGGWAIGEWAKAKAADGVTNRWKMTFSVPLAYYSGNPAGQPGATLAQIAAGACDSGYTWLANRLVLKGMADAVLRIGWEFNGSWYAWQANGDFIAAYRHVVDLFRAVPGQAFKFDWNPSLGANSHAPAAYYPGDAYVDYIGVDVYNLTYSGTEPTARWSSIVSQAYGLQWQADFAAAHGKQISFPEWGTCTKTSGQPAGAGDDPYFVAQMLLWIAGHNVAYHNYWDYTSGDCDGKLVNNSKPAAGAMMIVGMRAGPTAVATLMPALASQIIASAASITSLNGQVATLNGQVTTLTAARDGALASLATLTADRDAVAATLSATAEALATTTTERDTARADLQARTDERDLLTANLLVRTGERDAALAALDVRTADLATRTSERDQATSELAARTGERDALLAAATAAQAERDALTASVAAIKAARDAMLAAGAANDNANAAFRAAVGGL